MNNAELERPNQAITGEKIYLPIDLLPDELKPRGLWLPSVLKYRSILRQLFWRDKPTNKFMLDTQAGDDPSLDYQVATATANDGSIVGTSFDSSNMGIGNFFDIYNSWARWTGVTIPVGSTIGSNIYIAYDAYSSGGTVTNIKTRLFFNLSGDAVAPTDATTYNAKAVTTHYTDWTPTAWVADTWYNIDVSAIIAELVAAYDFSAGKAMMALHKNNGSSTYTYLRPYDYTNNTANAAKLHIEYSVAPPVAPAFKLKMIPKSLMRKSRLYSSLSLKGG